VIEGGDEARSLVRSRDVIPALGRIRNVMPPLVEELGFEDGMGDFIGVEAPDASSTFSRESEGDGAVDDIVDGVEVDVSGTTMALNGCCSQMRQAELLGRERK
jgi:hypothetical protein